MPAMTDFIHNTMTTGFKHISSNRVSARSGKSGNLVWGKNIREKTEKSLQGKIRDFENMCTKQFLVFR